MRKLLSTLLIISLIITIPIFSDESVHAYASGNIIDAPSKICAKNTLTFTMIGFNQNVIKPYDGEVRYIPDSYEISGPEDFFEMGDYKYVPVSYKLNVPGDYEIKVEFRREYFDQTSHSWFINDISYNDKKTKIVKVTAPKYKITLNANKGKISGKSKGKKKVTFNKKYGKLKKATRKNYKFIGWYTKKNGGKKVTSSTKVKNLKAHTLYAHWKKNPKKKTSSGNSGKGQKSGSSGSGGKHV